MVLMISAVVVLSLDKKEAVESDYDLTSKEMKMYGIFSIASALTAPFLWTFKTYYLVKRTKLAEEQEK